MLLLDYMEVSGHGQLLNNTQGACRDSLTEFKGKGRMISETAVFLRMEEQLNYPAA